jgi:hypothetical protein
MKPEAFAERKTELDGWAVKLSSYKLGDVFHCTADNVSPGAWLARTTGRSRQEAEQKALEISRRLLARTHRQAG